MAIMATDNKELHAAEEAYAAINRYDKVDYIRYIKVYNYNIFLVLYVFLLVNIYIFTLIYIYIYIYIFI